MSAFISAMDASNALTKTENGDACLKSSGSAALDLWFKLVRDLHQSPDFEVLVRAAISEATTVEAKADLIVIAFHTRGTRGLGKGERTLSFSLLSRLARAFGPEAICAVVGHLPFFGSWRDLVALLALDETPPEVKAKCEAVLIGQLEEDGAELENAQKAKRHPTLSLAAKWAPREGSSFDRKEKGGLAKRLSKAMFGSANPAASARKYRKLLSALNAALGTPEVLMASGRWAEIKMASVASVCLQRHRKAFLNEALKGRMLVSEEETGNRHPNDPARVAARKNLRAALLSKKGVQGKALLPHELVKKCMGGGWRRLSTLEGDLLDAQWAKVREGTVEAMAKAAEQRAAAVAAASAPLESVASLKAALPTAVDLGKLVALVDVSGSMGGLPMEVAIGLGILVSELAAPTFANRVLTFESSPSWVDLSACTTLAHKVRTVEAAGWGGSTDFEAACEKILEAAEVARLTPDQIPDLIVFSDMQFDQAYPPYGYRRSTPRWETALERLGRRFAEVGRAVCGEAYAPPRIIFWNLRGATVGVPAEASAPNTQLLSGFSPSLLKLVLSGEDLVADEEEVVQPDGSVKVVRAGPTPEQTYRAALDSPDFDVVRLSLSELEVGPFKAYAYARDALKEGGEEDGFELV